MSLKEIKHKIRGVEKTHKVTRAMEAVSAVKMRKSQERALSTRPFALAALSILRRLSGSLGVLHHPLLARRDIEKMCVVVITSDRGLAGNLNVAVLKATEARLRETGLPKERVGVIAVGRKGYEYFSKREYVIIDRIGNLTDDVTHEELRTLTEDVVRLFREGEYDSCLVSFSLFISTLKQRATIRQILPLSIPELAETVRDIIPQEGRYAELKDETELRELYTVEPDHETVLNALMPYLLQIKLYHTLLEAKASEHSARMVAMKNASEKAQELVHELTLSFNKERQSEITREVGEIVGGIEAMA